jgi:hypothetical protein
VAAAAFPFSRRNPFFVEEEPLDGPGDDSIDDRFIRPPVIFNRIINTQSRECGRIAQPVNVLGTFAGAARVGTDRRIDDAYADVGVRELPAIEEPPREIHDTDTVGLTNRTQRAFPYANPARVGDEAELGAFRPQFSILVLDR